MRACGECARAPPRVSCYVLSGTSRAVTETRELHTRSIVPPASLPRPPFFSASCSSAAATVVLPRRRSSRSPDRSRVRPPFLRPTRFALRAVSPLRSLAVPSRFDRISTLSLARLRNIHISHVPDMEMRYTAATVILQGIYGIYGAFSGTE